MGGDIIKYIEQLKKRELPDIEGIRFLCEKVREILVDEENVIQVSEPVTIVGDIHGQFYDLLELFKVGGVSFVGFN